MRIAGIAGSTSICISIAVLAMAGASAAVAQTALPQTQRSLPSHLSGQQGATLKPLTQRTCPNMLTVDAARRPDGGQMIMQNGWFFRAQLVTDRDRPGSAPFLLCDYGPDRVDPKKALSFSVRYDLAGIDPSRCTVNGSTLSCAQ